ncbi:MAG: hypothetical protein E7288_04635 [Lachnospiraceae bacterium]|nr:hypothetical protein [Lachnospiraceae bacterium]
MKEIFKKIWKKFEHFWEYYKWYAIVPIAIIAIVVSFVSTYIMESRPFALGVAIMNTSDVATAVKEFEINYAMERELELPVKVSYDFVHPKDMKQAALETDDTIASIQKYQTMMRNGYVDVTFTTDWVVKEYMQVPLYEDLRTYFDEAFLAEYEEYIYYIIKEEVEAEANRKAYEEDTGTLAETSEEVNWEEIGEKIPVAFYVEDCEALGEFYLDAKPVMAFSKDAKRKDETIAFAKWILEGMKKEDAD